MIIAAALCPAPPLLLPGLTGAAQVLPELRRACADALTELSAGRPDLVAVVGAGESTAVWDLAARVDVLSYAPGLAGAAPGGPGDLGGPGGALPVSLGVGCWTRPGTTGSGS